MEISSKGGRKRGKLARCCAAVAFCLLLAMGAPAEAARVVRIGSWDELRTAVRDPQSGDVIEVTGNIDRSQATGDKKQIVISRDLTIRGVGVGTSPVTIDGKTGKQGGPIADWDTRLFNVEDDEADSVTVKFENLVLTGGKVALTGSLVSGGAVLGTKNTALTFINCVIEGNEASGKQAHGGGVYAAGDATFRSCDVSGNTATGEDGNAQGGGVHLTDKSGATRTFTNCTVRGNVVSGTAEVFGGGVCSHDDVTFENCTVSGNVVSGDAAGSNNLEGGGVFVFKNGIFTNCTVSGNKVTGKASDAAAGGGIWVQTNSSLVMTNCTVADNKVETPGTATPSGGGIRGAKVNGVTLVNCTVTGNTVKKNEGTDNGSGGGVYVDFNNNDNARLTLAGSIVAGNTAATANSKNLHVSDANKSESLGYNLADDGVTAGVFDQTSDKANATLEDIFGQGGPTLADNGGPVKTIKIKDGSQGFADGQIPEDHVYRDSPTELKLPATDARGVKRPYPYGHTGASIGAYECTGEAALSATTVTVSPASVNVRPGAEVTLTAVVNPGATFAPWVTWRYPAEFMFVSQNYGAGTITLRAPAAVGGPHTITATSDFDKDKDGSALVTVANPSPDDGGGGTQPSTAATLSNVSTTVGGTRHPGELQPDGKTFLILVPHGTDISHLPIAGTLSPGATSVPRLPTSHDFTKGPLEIVVTAQDGKTKATYTVIVQVEDPAGPIEQPLFTIDVNDCEIVVTRNADGTLAVKVRIPFAQDEDPNLLDTVRMIASLLGLTDISYVRVDAQGSETSVPRMAAKAPYLEIRGTAANMDAVKDGAITSIQYTLKGDNGLYAQTFPDGLKVADMPGYPKTPAPSGGSSGCDAGAAGLFGLVLCGAYMAKRK